MGVYRKAVLAAMPQSSGIYVIAKVLRVHGFPVQMEPLYVGQAVNLRRRTEQHQHLLEPNPGLNGIDGTEELEIWWQSVAKEDLNTREAELIQGLQPVANRRGKKRKGGM
jgi:excinuclease UvrABC nuclease subunit